MQRNVRCISLHQAGCSRQNVSASPAMAIDEVARQAAAKTKLRINRFRGVYMRRFSGCDELDIR